MIFKRFQKKVLVPVLSVSLLGSVGYLPTLNAVRAFNYNISDNTYRNETFNLVYKIPNDAHVLPEEFLKIRYEGELREITSSMENVQLAVESNSHDYFFSGYEAYIITENANHKSAEQIVSEKLNNSGSADSLKGLYDCNIGGTNFKCGWSFTPNKASGVFEKIFVTVKNDQAFIILVTHPNSFSEDFIAHPERASQFAKLQLPELDGHFYAGFSSELSVSNTSVEYVVKSGDSLTKIARMFSVPDYRTIARDNNISNPNLIYVGQKLIIRR